MKSPTKKSSASSFFGEGILSRIFKFLASLYLAVGTLVTLMIVLAAGTIIESRYGADPARIVIYNSPWFGAILIVLVINLACSAFDRLPWKKKHIGFVLTHLGIITILAGSLATQQLAIDGQMALEEGASEKWIALKQPVLYFYSQEFKDERQVPIKEHAFAWEGKTLLAGLKAENKKAEISLIKYYPKARATAEWGVSETGPAALKVTLQNSFLNVSEWLADEADSREVQMGPALLKLAPDFIDSTETSERPHLEITQNGKTAHINLPADAALSSEQTLDNGLKVKVLEVYEFAYVEDNVLKEGKAAEHAENPAVILEVSSNDQREKHTVFANFPDFPTVHSRPESQFGLKIRLISSHAAALEPKNELRFVVQPDGLHYQLKKGEQLEKGKVAIGKDTPTGWMDLKFRVEEFYPHAAANLNIKKLASDDQSANSTAAAQIEIRSGENSKQLWLAEGIHKTVMFEGALFEFVFARKRIPLGFEIMLKDFRVNHDPGTDKPASFESDVVVKDFTRGTTLNKTISMNQPLNYCGFKVFQAGYTPNPDGKDFSSFAIGRDPGIPIKYAGALIMVSGILLMFYTRAYSLRNEKGIK